MHLSAFLISILRINRAKIRTVSIVEALLLLAVCGRDLNLLVQMVTQRLALHDLEAGEVAGGLVVEHVYLATTDCDQEMVLPALARALVVRIGYVAAGGTAVSVLLDAPYHLLIRLLQCVIRVMFAKISE